MPTPEDIIAAAIQDVARLRRRVWEDSIRTLTESPIEELFLAAVYASNIDWADNPVHIYVGQYDGDGCRFEGDHLWPQAKVGSHRVDFLFEHVAPRVRRRVIVECDGHDFHEKTKEKVAADKARDRFLIGRGYQVLRFSGSEIYRDPGACWGETRNILWGLAEAA